MEDYEMTEFQSNLIKAFEIPVRDVGQKIWMLRTESGRFYRDFTRNNYVALGWDKVPFSVISDTDTDEKTKKEKISVFYPDETRPGLILSQLRTFYFRMKAGDLVLIPSESSKQLFMGKIGEVIANIEHIEADEDYDKCEYSHKRAVKWIKAISPNIDVYLNKALKSHQAITDVTEYADLFYRNIFSYYIEENSIHLTFQKNTESTYTVCDSIQFQTAVIDIFQATSKMYGLPDNSSTYKLKTAVGSPGIIEFIVENFDAANIIAAVLVVSVFGINVSKDSEGNISFSIGITSIIDRVNQLLNDHTNRKLVDAQIRKSDAETAQILSAIHISEAESAANVKKIEAEVKESEANAQKTLSESKQIDAETEKILSSISAEQLQASESSIINPMDRLQQISEQNDITISA